MAKTLSEGGIPNQLTVIEANSFAQKTLEAAHVTGAQLAVLVLCCVFFSSFTKSSPADSIRRLDGSTISMDDDGEEWA